MTQGLRWVLDVDIRKYFDSIPHKQLREFLDRRVTDGVIRRMIDKWLKAGVMEEGQLRQSTEGSPQGGVISPLLSNIYLHHVLDEWFEAEVDQGSRGDAPLSDMQTLVMALEDFPSTKRALPVLGKRLARYGLTLQPERTRFIDSGSSDRMKCAARQRAAQRRRPSLRRCLGSVQPRKRCGASEHGEEPLCPRARFRE